MDIRIFAQICKLIAEGKDASPLLPLNMITSYDMAEMAELARDQRVLPLWASAITARKEKSARVVGTVVQTPVHYLMTNMRIKAQLLEIDKHLNNTTIKPILLKGAVQLFDGVYQSIGMRYMADIDILVTGEKFGLALRELGYGPKNPEVCDKYDVDGKPVLKLGQRHLTPVMRPNDSITVEPHLLAVDPMYRHLLPSDFAETAIPIPGCRQLLQPNRLNYLVVALIHGLMHDRDRFDGALLLRSLIECELLYEQLSPFEKETLAKHFLNCGSQSFFIAWRTLADWLFLGDDSAQMRSIASFFLISEFKARAQGYRMVFLISVLNRLLAFANIRYWSSGGAARDGLRFVQKDFWERVFEKLNKAFRG